MTSNTHLRKTLLAMKAADLAGFESICARHDVGSGASIDSLIAEIQRDGANTLVTYTVRLGEGVDYDEILSDVAWAIGAEQPANVTIDAREKAVVEKVLSEMKESERQAYEELRKRVSDAGTDRELIKSILKVAANAGLYVARKQVVAFLVAQGLERYAGRAAGYWIPGINVLLGLLTANDLAGPAYRKTIPTVIDLAFFRYGQGEI